MSLISGIFYSSSVEAWRNLDTIFNNRISMNNSAIQLYGLNLIGAGRNAVNYSSISAINIDNGYMNNLIGDGIIIFIILIYFWTKITHIAEKKRNFYLLIALVIIAYENLINNHLTSFKLIPFLCILINDEDAFI